jgi:two-component system nitrogen regulation sensor histidine kinase GlnL
MIALPVCVLYSQDADLSRRVNAFLRSMADVRRVTEADRLEPVLEQSRPALLFLDLRARESRDLLQGIQQDWPDVLIIALGTPRSEPLRDAEQAGIYAAEDLDLERRRFQALTGRALEHLRLLQENRDLREETALVPMRDTAYRMQPAQDRHSASALPFLRFPRVFRRFENIDVMLAVLVESVGDAAGITRVGIFARPGQSDCYRLRAGIRCLPETDEIEFGKRDALARWFERNAHIVSRDNLQECADRNDRAILRRALDTLGAEAIVPLHGTDGILGWIFFGHKTTGQRFNDGDLERLMMLAENVSTVLENATLHEETTLQRTLAETLLKSIPPGVVAIDEDGIIRWFNPMAEALLGVSAERALHKPVEVAGGTIAAFLRDTLDAGSDLPPRQWTQQNSRKPVSVETRRLLDRETKLGAVAVINDLTAEQSTRQKQDVVDRAAFWADLAASMSHEIRNPLVAIKTFAQLLPERFEDADFRKEFNRIVVQEIDRLDNIITQINDFAHPPELVLRPIDVRSSVEKGVEIARSRFGFNGNVSLQKSLPNDLPAVLGDEGALAEAFAHLLANAAEATSEQEKRTITLSAKPLPRARGVVVTVTDNGHGIDPDLKDKIFSPFCTTKARGMGLGLPIVKRVVFDHNGKVDVHSGPKGTEVSVMLPSDSNGR